MTRIILLSLVLTFSLSAKTLDNKAFCEAIERGKEASELKEKGLTVKGNRLQEEVEAKLKTMIIVGTEVIPDEKLRVLKQGSINTIKLECFNGEYFQSVGFFWVCSKDDKINCNSKRETNLDIIEKIEEESQGSDVSLKGSFIIPPLRSKGSSIYYNEIDGFKAMIKISKLVSIDKL